MTLPARDRAVLAFERLRWKNRGAKDTAILVLFGLSFIAYGQMLWTIVDKPAAEEYDPEHVRRLRRLRDARRQNRAARAVGFEIA
jgi:hypothetical protein